MVVPQRAQEHAVCGAVHPDIADVVIAVFGADRQAQPAAHVPLPARRQADDPAPVELVDLRAGAIGLRICRVRGHGPVVVLDIEIGIPARLPDGEIADQARRAPPRRRIGRTEDIGADGAADDPLGDLLGRAPCRMIGMERSLDRARADRHAVLGETGVMPQVFGLLPWPA
jgi:hypothetical protein